MDLQTLRSRKAEIEALAAEYGISNIRVFGSVARGDARPDSDVDLLVDCEPEASLFDVVRLQAALEDMTGAEVHITPSGGLRPAFRERIQDDLTAL